MYALCSINIAVATPVLLLAVLVKQIHADTNGMFYYYLFTPEYRYSILCLVLCFVAMINSVAAADTHTHKSQTVSITFDLEIKIFHVLFVSHSSSNICRIVRVRAQNTKSSQLTRSQSGAALANHSQYDVR